MNNIAILKILLSFCGSADYELTCRYEMIECFEEQLKKVESETAFRNCLDQNYEKYIYKASDE